VSIGHVEKSESHVARFLALYGVLYAAFGVQSPYLPSLLDSHGLPPEAIALVLAAGAAIPLAAGPAACRLADRLDAPKAVLIVCSAAAGLIALRYLPARGLWPLFIVGVIHSATLAPLAPLSDTLALGSAAPARVDARCARGFYYSWLRCAGSAAFILGTVLSGQAIGGFGIIAVVCCRTPHRGGLCPNCASIAIDAKCRPARDGKIMVQGSALLPVAALRPHRSGCIDPR
jgi:PPP family 3-phenylpropionic acid transporter